MDVLAALVGFSFVMSVSPGPNNVLLWASGAEFGIRRTLPHVVGTALGIGAMALGAAAGLGALVTTIPEIGFAMKAGGSLYLLYLAIRIGAAGALERGIVARPLGLIEAATFQALNPKGWIFALGAMAAFRPVEIGVIAGSLLVTITMMLVVIPTAALWAAAGGALSRFLARERARRVAGVVLGGLVAATVIFVWI